MLVRKLISLTRKRGFFEGPLASWEEASQRASGYKDKEILEKVLSAALKVKTGEFAYEQDSVLFNTIHYSWPVIAGLMHSAARNEGKLCVLDFGGSLGSSYFQNREFLKDLREVRWLVVEQPHYVEQGRRLFQDNRLLFFPSIDNCLACETPQLALISSTLQYFPESTYLLRKIASSNVETIIVSRTPFSQNDRDLYFLQVVDPSIYVATLPFRVLSSTIFLKTLLDLGYTLKASNFSKEGTHPHFSYGDYIFVR